MPAPLRNTYGIAAPSISQTKPCSISGRNLSGQMGFTHQYLQVPLFFWPLFGVVLAGGGRERCVGSKKWFFMKNPFRICLSEGEVFVTNK